MSKKLYEDFLVEHFCKWAAKGFEGESRFQFRSPDSSNSQNLYEALLRKADTTVEILTADINQQFKALSLADKKLIPVVHSESENEFFIS